ncbi:hypothetical protein OROHE_006178 [Orobanche hederae]
MNESSEQTTQTLTQTPPTPALSSSVLPSPSQLDGTDRPQLPLGLSRAAPPGSGSLSAQPLLAPTFSLSSPDLLNNGSFIVRSERVEAKALQLYNQRCDVVAEGIISAFQRETKFDDGDDHENEEGAKLMKLLETAAEPELLMAGMSIKLSWINGCKQMEISDEDADEESKY